MRGLLSAALTVLFCLGSASITRAQNPALSSRPQAPRPPLISPRAELLRPIRPNALDADWLRPASIRGLTELAPAPASRDSAANPARRCPMPVARPDTTSLERMPVDRRDSTR